MIVSRCCTAFQSRNQLGRSEIREIIGGARRTSVFNQYCGLWQFNHKPINALTVEVACRMQYRLEERQNERKIWKVRTGVCVCVCVCMCVDQSVKACRCIIVHVTAHPRTGSLHSGDGKKTDIIKNDRQNVTCVFGARLFGVFIWCMDVFVCVCMGAARPWLVDAHGDGN